MNTAAVLLRWRARAPWLGRGAVLAAIAVALTACGGDETAYERGVADYEPVYCYASLADATCYRRPYFRDDRRLINHYGPTPRSYDRPKPPKPARLDPPPPERKATGKGDAKGPPPPAI
ncbi:MAG: hypothetical protein WAS73_15645 [Defluviicoccus sp.]